MSSGYSRYIPYISFLGELTLLNLLFVVGFILHQPSYSWHAESLLLYLYINGVWLTISYFSRAFEIHRHSKLQHIVLHTFYNSAVFFFLFLLYFQFRTFNYYSRDLLKLVLILFMVCLFIWKMGLHLGFLYYRRLGFNFRKVVFIGINDAVVDIHKFMKSENWYGYKSLGYIGNSQDTRMKKLGEFSHLHEVMQAWHPDEVYIAYTSLTSEEKDLLAEKLSAYPVQVNLVPDLGNFLYQKVEWRDLGNMPVMALHTGPLALWGNKFVKRSFDVIFSLFIIFFLLGWVTLILFILDLFTKNQGIWYTQRRTSLNGKTFKILKFRSMVHNDQADIQQAVQNDVRITPVGAFLRKTNIDELPQFVNVLFGQMSVIGPRPHMLAHTEAYSRQVSKYMFRHFVKPGISGLAQVSGYRGEVRNLDDIRRRVEKDIEYIKRWSFWLDIWIIWQTCWLVVREFSRIKKQ